MCIALLTTAHPDYALIVIDNRDEYVLRPTSRPHWWKQPKSGEQVLSSRDLQRSDKGTWLGITSSGLFAVLTNFREPIDQTQTQQQQDIAGVKSRGSMVKAWLAGELTNDGGLMDGVKNLVEDVGVKGVGGFSMVCGRLRKGLRREGIAIVSNRVDEAAAVPVICRKGGGVWGLSNAVYDTENEWPKVAKGKALLAEAVSAAEGQEDLLDRLFRVLDNDSLPGQDEDLNFAERLTLLRHSIFIPELGDEAQKQAMGMSIDDRGSPFAWAENEQESVEEQLQKGDSPRISDTQKELDRGVGFNTGVYGTQRQTVVLVDWEGKVTFVERALWDMNGKPVPRGEGDVKFEFRIQGWNEE